MNKFNLSGATFNGVTIITNTSINTSNEFFLVVQSLLIKIKSPMETVRNALLKVGFVDNIWMEHNLNETKLCILSGNFMDQDYDNILKELDKFEHEIIKEEDGMQGHDVFYGE
jgi:hypothetical protein